MNIFKTYFEFYDLILLFIGILFAIVAIFYQEIKEKDKIAISLIIISALILRIFVANLDPFFSIWDEQYHMLVAKNMLLHPFKPALYSDPALPYFYKYWNANNIWLHKQPLFLWQIALSFKIFGVGFFAGRIPSIIMSTIVVYFVYDIAKRLFNSKVGFYAALLMCGQNYILLLVSGCIPTDHNDIAFLFYVTASIWAWIRYSENNSVKWALLIGLFAGLAVLNKWLTGLLVYFGWFWAIVISSNRRDISLYVHYILSLIMCCIVFLPWQIYLFYVFPLESQWEHILNYMHFSQVIENHSGNFWFHFSFFIDIYGYLLALIFTLGILILSLKYRKSNKLIVLSLFLNVVIAYLFFSLAKTKMYSFTTFVSSIILIIAAYSINYIMDYLIRKIKLKPIITKSTSLIIIFLIFIYSLNIEKIQDWHTDKVEKMKYIRINKSRSYDVITQLSSILPDKNYVLFNLFPKEHITTMIFTENTAYDFIPSIEQIKYLKQRNKKIAIFENDSIPEYIKSDTTIIKIKSAMWNNLTFKKPKIYL